MPKQAARVTDMTQHGGLIIPPTAMFTMIENLPAARLMDMHTCPMVTVLVPHVGGPIILASFTTFIENMPAARVQDLLICVGPPDMIQMGAMVTFIGDGMGGAMATMNPPCAAAPGAGGHGVADGGHLGGSWDAGGPAAGNAGAPVDQCTTEGDPVDVATGRMFTYTEEFATQGSPAFRFQRFYSTSSAAQAGAFGYGWSHSLEERLEIAEKTITYCDWQGRRILFPQIPPDEEYIHHLDEHVTLRRTANDYRVEFPGEKTLVFAPPPEEKFSSHPSSLIPHPSIRVARLQEITDDAGRTIRLEYEGLRLRRLTDALGNQVQFGSQDGKHIHAITFRARGTDVESPIARYEYDAGGNLVAAADALSYVTRYFYDGSHRMIQKTDRNGYAFSFEYDYQSRCTRTRGQDGLFDQTFVYHDTLPLTTVRDSQGRTTSYYHNSLGMVNRVVDAQGNEQKFEYEGANLVKQVDALGRARTYKYDKHARVLVVKSPGGGETKTEYMPDGSQKRIDAEGHALVAQRVDNAFLLRLEDAPAPLLTTTWDPDARTTEHRDGAGNPFTLAYDEADRVLACTYPLGQRVAFEYDSYGNRVAVIDPTGAQIRFGYDLMGRLTKVEREGGSGFQFHYDAEGEISHYVDGNGRTTHFTRDGFHRLAAVANPANQTTRYEYDNGNRLRKIVDGRAAEILFDYDELGRVQRILYPGGRSEFLTFDPAGQLTRFLDRGGVGVNCEYDADGRVASMQYVDGTGLTFAYDKDGRIVGAANADTEVAFAYDGYGRLVSETQNGAAVEYTYDESGVLSALTTPAGETLKFTYDANGRLARVCDWNGGEHSFDYTDAGPVKTHRFPNGLTARFVYSRLGLPVQMGLGREGDPRPLVLCAYRYDGNDCVTEAADSVLGRVAYRYDAAGRLAAAQHQNASGSEAFTYDPNGNITGRGRQTGYTYDPCNQFQSGPQARCRHDRRGNVVEIEQEGRGTLRLTYNGQNLLTRAELADGTVVEYAYDPFGRRIRKKHGDRETQYVWAGNQLLGEATTDGKKEETRWYLFLPGTFTPLAMRVDGQVYYFHTDHRGAPTRVSDAEGNFVWVADYTAFGEAHVRMSEITQSLRLPGQFLDPETGLHYNRARYYHPQWGRYLTPDPLGFKGGLNFYVYADNDPINRSDPMGMAPKNKHNQSVPATVGQSAGPNGDAVNAAGNPDPKAMSANSAAGDTMSSNPEPTTTTPVQAALSGPGTPPQDAPAPAQGSAGCPQGSGQGGAGGQDVQRHVDAGVANAAMGAPVTNSAGPPSTQPSAPAGEPSGAQWVSRFPGSTSTGDLSQPFRGNVEKFIGALQQAGASVTISATLRPPERAYLMHYSWEIAQNGLDPRTVPAMAGVNILWAHTDAGGNYDSAASIAAAQAMVAGYGIVHAPALTSNHTAGRAIDMNISWSGNLVITDGGGKQITITSTPRTGAGNTDLRDVGASFGVTKLASDPPHWSDDGH